MTQNMLNFFRNVLDIESQCQSPTLKVKANKKTRIMRCEGIYHCLFKGVLAHLVVQSTVLTRDGRLIHGVT